MSEKLSVRLKTFRKNKAITQKEFAKIYEFSESSVASWEMKIRFPTRNKLVRLSEILNCSLDELLK